MCMVDSKENYKFDVGVKGLSAVTRPPFSFTRPPSEPYRRGMSLEEKKAQPIAFKSGAAFIEDDDKEIPFARKIILFVFVSFKDL
ncbi:unnamed protein product [Pocillopora meandrina]|uniref:Uncharacterized protein n=1 Tax=Pocillopora meandrina TaxID=46732 RepID=A0AAU9WEP8_9CNID|nr:unnamed protein product [Pocillopora meandrina]